MRPQGTRAWRKDGRRARRGVPTGRRATHIAETTYGRHQKDRDWRESWDAALRAAREEQAARQEAA
jgi:hypothetical protein